MKDRQSEAIELKKPPDPENNSMKEEFVSPTTGDMVRCVLNRKQFIVPTIVVDTDWVSNS